MDENGKKFGLNMEGLRCLVVDEGGKVVICRNEDSKEGNSVVDVLGLLGVFLEVFKVFREGFMKVVLLGRVEKAFGIWVCI